MSNVCSIHSLPDDDISPKNNFNYYSLLPTKTFPSDIIDLSNAVLQVPINNMFSTVTDLVGYSDSHFYCVDDYIVCKIESGAPTSKGSHFPRTELKSTKIIKSKDQLECDFSITQLPVKFQKIVFAQIKVINPNLEIQFLIDGKDLIVRDLNSKHHLIKTNYILGTWFNLKVNISDGNINVELDNVEVLLLSDVTFNNANFKVGNYMQSSNTLGEKDCSSLVLIKNLIF